MTNQPTDDELTPEEAARANLERALQSDKWCVATAHVEDGNLIVSTPMQDFSHGDMPLFVKLLKDRFAETQRQALERN